jgi:hypothetical protein
MTNLVVQDKEGRLMGLSVIITEKNKKPAVELRSLTTNPHLIKTLLGAAYRNVPIIILPKFTNPVQSLNTAISKGILYKTLAITCSYCNTLAPEATIKNPCVSCGKTNYLELNKEHYFFTETFENLI